MDQKTRLSATRYIWTAFFFSLAVVNAGVFVNSAPLDVANVILTIVVAIAAVGSTAIVWNSALPVVEEYQQEAMSSARKRKRNARVDRLLAQMDDDELDVLRQRLEDEVEDDIETGIMLGDDGELVQHPLRQ